MNARARLRLLTALAVAAAVAGVAIAAKAWREPDPNPPISGIVRQTEIRVAPETMGRLASIAVSPGQHVRQGDLLAVLDNPDLIASAGEAKAAEASARADRDNVYAGVRAEEVAIAAEAVRTAEANLLLAQHENARVVALSAKDFASRQQLDESNASLAKAQADLDLKRAQYAAANAGPVAEERALADAKVALAQATVADLEAAVAKMRLTAPVDGTIGIRVAEPGEIMTPGKPVMTMEADGQRWFTFTLREDALRDMAIGAIVTVNADDGRRIEARLTELRPLGEFATWRAARAVGDHDLNSFGLRLDPTATSQGLEPGMTVQLPGR